MSAAASAPGKAATLEIIAFHLGDQQFSASGPPRSGKSGAGQRQRRCPAPPHVIGVMNLRGTVIPVIDLAARLGMAGTIDSSRSAIVVAEMGGSILGLIVDRVSDILSISGDDIQPLPELGASFDPGYA